MFVRSSECRSPHANTAVISSCKLLTASTKCTLLGACPPCRSALRRRVTPKHQVEPRPSAGGTFLSGEEDGEDRKNSRPQEGHGHQQIHRLPQVREGHTHSKAHQGSRARCSGRDLHLVLGLRILRKALKG